MNVMKAIDSKPHHDFFGAADDALEHLKCYLANGLHHEEAFRVSEMLRDLDRTRRQYDQRNNDPLNRARATVPPFGGSNRAGGTQSHGI